MNPGRRQRYRRAIFSAKYPVSWLQPQYAIVGFNILRSAREIIKSTGRHVDEHAANECGPFARPLLRILAAVFPFKHSPAIETILRQLGEDTLEIDLPVTRTAEAPGTIFPIRIATIDTRPG